MKILAVIPARAGSKGIPNKNIRILNGKPLISYCIENAIKCEMISDIIVSTDSEEVKLVADHYGIKYRERESRLCEDNVTLDAVIYDACRDIDADYIVTLQPTSPTLDYRTLNSAINYAIKNDYDTLISVVNKPHLAWVEKEGDVVPDYAERLNRQYLPKRYEETGAFVISKKSVVNENTRIGDKIGVFELSEKEAIDIDNFQDMLAAEYILRGQRIGIVVDGNNTIGLGHIVRMLELADMFYTKPIFFFDNNKTKKESFGETTYTLVGYNSLDELLERIKEYEFTLIINDKLDTDKDYIISLRNTGVKVVNFEDAGSGADYADIVINALYDKEAAHRYVGPDYYLIPKLFSLYKPITVNEKINNVFICFGGADPKNYTDIILEEIKKDCYKEYNFTIVLGRSKHNYETLIKLKTDNISIKYDVKNMPEIMSNCDIAITSQGRTCFELASLGIPAMSFAQNSREEKHVFVSPENGFIRKGILNKNEVIESVQEFVKIGYETRVQMHNRMLKTDLYHGRERVKALIDAL